MKMDEIEPIYFSQLLDSLNEDNAEDEWSLVPHDGIKEIIEERIRSLDYHSHGYITGSHVYWSGILTLEPFDDLYDRFDCEEAILNAIKDNNLKVSSSPEGLKVEFHNPHTSPLYEFFNTYKDGFGGNIPSSIQGLLSNIEKFLKEDIIENTEVYGIWNFHLCV